MCLGMPGKVVEIGDAAHQRATVDVAGVHQDISIAMLADDELRVGDWVLVHVGLALSTMDEDEAAETLDALKSLNEMYEEQLPDYFPAQ